MNERQSGAGHDDVLAVLHRVLTVLDEQMEHLAAAHVSQAISALDSKAVVAAANDD